MPYYSHAFYPSLIYVIRILTKKGWSNVKQIESMLKKAQYVNSKAKALRMAIHNEAFLPYDSQAFLSLPK